MREHPTRENEPRETRTREQNPRNERKRKRDIKEESETHANASTLAGKWRESSAIIRNTSTSALLCPFLYGDSPRTRKRPNVCELVQLLGLARCKGQGKSHPPATTAEHIRQPATHPQIGSLLAGGGGEIINIPLHIFPYFLPCRLFDPPPFPVWAGLWA